MEAKRTSKMDKMIQIIEKNTKIAKTEKFEKLAENPVRRTVPSGRTGNEKEKNEKF